MADDRRRHVGLTNAEHRDIHGTSVLDCEACHSYVREQLDERSVEQTRETDDRPERPLSAFTGGDA